MNTLLLTALAMGTIEEMPPMPQVECKEERYTTITTSGPIVDKAVDTVRLSKRSMEFNALVREYMTPTGIDVVRMYKEKPWMLNKHFESLSYMMGYRDIYTPQEHELKKKNKHTLMKKVINYYNKNGHKYGLSKGWEEVETDMKYLMLKYKFKGLFQVVFAESNFECNAYNDASGAVGWFQFHPGGIRDIYARASYYYYTNQLTPKVQIALYDEYLYRKCKDGFDWNPLKFMQHQYHYFVFEKQNTKEGLEHIRIHMEHNMNTFYSMSLEEAEKLEWEGNFVDTYFMDYLHKQLETYKD